METTSTERCFADTLSDLHEEFQNEETRAQWRADSTWQATEYFLEQLLGSEESWTKFTENAMDAVRTSGKKTLSLTTWQGRGPSYRGQFLSDLFDLGSLREKLQDVLDMRGGEGRFMIFKHPVPSVRGPRTFSLTVSWDTTGFTNALNIIDGEREKALARQERAQTRRDGSEDDGEETEDRPQRRQFEAHREPQAHHRDYPVRRDVRQPQYDDQPRHFSNGPRRYNEGPRPQRRNESGPRRYNDTAPQAPRRTYEDSHEYTEARPSEGRPARPSQPHGFRKF